MLHEVIFEAIGRDVLEDYRLVGIKEIENGQAAQGVQLFVVYLAEIDAHSPVFR